MTTLELLAILSIGALFLCALAAIVSQEREEADIYKNWSEK